LSLLLLLKQDIYCSTYNKPERPGITESIKSLKHKNVKIISFEAAFKTVLVGGLAVRDNLLLGTVMMLWMEF